MAELGFFGVRVMTWMQTPRRKGELSKAGDLDLCFSLLRPLRTNWLIVGISRKNSVPPCPGRQTERGIYQGKPILQQLFASSSRLFARCAACPVIGHAGRYNSAGFCCWR